MTLQQEVEKQIKAMKAAGSIIPESQGLEALALRLARLIGDTTEVTGPVASMFKELRETLKTLRRDDVKDDTDGQLKELLGTLSTPVRHTEEQG